MSLRSPSSTLRYTGMGVGAGLVRLRLSEHWLDAGGDHVLSPEDLGHERLRPNDTSHRGALGFQSRLERWMSREPVSREDRMNFSPRSAFAVPMDGLGFTTARWCRSGLGKHGRGRRPPAGQSAARSRRAARSRSGTVEIRLVDQGQKYTGVRPTRHSGSMKRTRPSGGRPTASVTTPTPSSRSERPSPEMPDEPLLSGSQAEGGRGKCRRLAADHLADLMPYPPGGGSSSSLHPRHFQDT